MTADSIDHHRQCGCGHRESHHSGLYGCTGGTAEHPCMCEVHEALAGPMTSPESPTTTAAHEEDES